MEPQGYLYIITCANLTNTFCMHFSVKESAFTVSCAKFMKISAPSFFRHLSYGVKQVWRRALLLRFWRLQMRAKYQAEISSSEEATFTKTPPGTGIILFATDFSHSGGQHLKISRLELQLSSVPRRNYWDMERNYRALCSCEANNKWCTVRFEYH